MILKPMGIPGVCPKHERAWTPEEDELLINLHGKKTVAEIAAQMPAPGRTRAAASNRMQVLRELYPERIGFILRPYTRGDDDFIRKNSHTMSIAEVAVQLNRTHGSVSARARKIGASFYKCGEKHNRAKYKDDLVIRTQEWRDDFGLTFSEISKRLNVPNHVAKNLYKRLTADYSISREYMPQ